MDFKYSRDQAPVLSVSILLTNHLEIIMQLEQMMRCKGAEISLKLKLHEDMVTKMMMRSLMTSGILMELPRFQVTGQIMMDNRSKVDQSL